MNETGYLTRKKQKNNRLVYEKFLVWEQPFVLFGNNGHLWIMHIMCALRKQIY